MGALGRFLSRKSKILKNVLNCRVLYNVKIRCFLTQANSFFHILCEKDILIYIQKKINTLVEFFNIYSQNRLADTLAGPYFFNSARQPDGADSRGRPVNPESEFFKVLVWLLLPLQMLLQLCQVVHFGLFYSF